MSALPADIAAAIDALEQWHDDALRGYGGGDYGTVRAALDAAILARLARAEAALRGEQLIREDHVRIINELRDHHAAALARLEQMEAALKPFADICDAEHMKYVRDEQVLELVTRAEVTVSEKLRGRDFRAARAALAAAPGEEG